MKFAYADPPYLGQGHLYPEHALAGDWNDPETHRQLIERLQDQYPDGWALSLSTPSLRILAPMMPEDIRWASWSKPFAVFKPNVNPAYTWEPVAFRGGRKRDRTKETVKDHHIEVITLKRGVVGAKPPGFAAWIPQLLGADVRENDTITDLFHGSGAMLGVWRSGLYGRAA